MRTSTYDIEKTFLFPLYNQVWCLFFKLYLLSNAFFLHRNFLCIIRIILTWKKLKQHSFSRSVVVQYQILFATDNKKIRIFFMAHCIILFIFLVQISSLCNNSEYSSFDRVFIVITISSDHLYRRGFFYVVLIKAGLKKINWLWIVHYFSICFNFLSIWHFDRLLGICYFFFGRGCANKTKIVQNILLCTCILKIYLIDLNLIH